MPRRNRNKKRHKRKRPKQPNLVKATADITKLAVTGLVGAGLISTTAATMRELTGK